MFVCYSFLSTFVGARAWNGRELLIHIIFFREVRSALVVVVARQGTAMERKTDHTTFCSKPQLAVRKRDPAFQSFYFYFYVTFLGFSCLVFY
ncbi:hypothetical protein B0T26DRAFT_198139 [Lasiosphaeria miniovina]|uniref:Uncharacterized protein n=1 Tax=Lasiosphaeria miniovina TaxID=1954250 RepID=A0AA40AU40_9PEZI|nr:uncharacterized protein B0T26DRAFT_198139 [Lasiosphaeria miniovina]KAK0722003.1 hypothetical protein B0T26DRAFT_198139 [Lasiosphaeria miniovina]